MNLEKWHLASSFPVKARDLPCSCGSYQFDFWFFKYSLLLSCLKVLNPENLSWENYLLVFTKSLNSNFRAFLLVPLTQNILGYSLFGTGINMASCFAIVFLVANESAAPTKTMQTTKFGLLVFIGRSRKLFSDWICNKIYSENVFDKIIPLSDLIYYYKN